MCSVCGPDPFTIITREAGAGSISLGVEGPSKAVIDYQDRRDGTSDVNYTVTEPGAVRLAALLIGQLRYVRTSVCLFTQPRPTRHIM